MRLHAGIVHSLLRTAVEPHGGPGRAPRRRDTGTESRALLEILCWISRAKPVTGWNVTDLDGWTIRTRDGSLAAHYEHTIMMTRGEPVILIAA
jgi:hypothetical protein